MLVKALFLSAIIGLISGQNPRIINVTVPEHGRVTFESPSYPSIYPAHQHVHYVITGPKNLVLELDVEKLDMDIFTDALFLTEIIPGWGSIAFGTVAGKDGLLPTEFRSATDSVVGIFKFDSSVGPNRNKGFKIGVQSARAPVESTDSLMVNCTHGRLSWSEEKFLDTDKLQVHFAVDHTIKCRSLLYDAHVFILDPKGKKLKTARSATPIALGPISVTCSSAGLVVSEEDPDNSEAQELTFKTTSNLNCRRIFVSFLNRFSKL